MQRMVTATFKLTLHMSLPQLLISIFSLLKSIFLGSWRMTYGKGSSYCRVTVRIMVKNSTLSQQK